MIAVARRYGSIYHGRLETIETCNQFPNTALKFHLAQSLSGFHYTCMTACCVRKGCIPADGLMHVLCVVRRLLAKREAVAESGTYPDFTRSPHATIRISPRR